MASHHHHEHEGASLAQAAQTALTDAGEQWTDMRSDIFSVLATFEKPASAYDIADLVSKKRGKRVAPNSVYRILDLFVTTNLARRVESANAYIDKLSNNVRVAAEHAGFAHVRPVIEVRGKCADCD
jgi:Fur family transcriptional regulator, zinc uptake regulator